MPEYLFDHIHNIFTKMDEADKILLLLDYDGTLVSFRKKPMDVETSNEVKTLLTCLVQNPKFTVFIVTGRTIQEIRQLLDIDGLSFAALHGLQIKLANGQSYCWQPNNNIQSVLEKIKKHAINEFYGERGIYIEDKRITLAFHYRMLAEDKIHHATRKFLDIVTKMDADKTLEIIHGAKVVEIIPKGWNKGMAIEYIFTKINDLKDILPIYVGDDTTDEDAFRTIGNDGITIFVSNNSNRSTEGQYWVNDPADVLKFLKSLQLKMIKK